MVRFATLALFLLSATSVVLDARPTHKRRAVCNTDTTTTTKTVTATATKVNVEAVKTSTTKTSSGFKTVTKTTTSSKATGTPDSSDDNGDLSGSVSANALFPVPGVNSGWSVAKASIPQAKDVTLTDKTFIVHKEASTSKRPVVTFSGKKAIRARMTKGSVTPGTSPAGGFSFYSPGATLNGNSPIVDLSKANEMTFGYSIFFEEGYNFNLGGKLPGLYGGINDDVAATCSGGRHNPGCWSARLMFRQKGEAELYLYIPPGVNQNDNKCGKKANSKCPSTGYGNSVGRGTWNWTPGKWMTVVQRLKLNTPGKADGEAEVFINGKSVLNVKGITWRTNKAAVARGVQMQIFHGGHTKQWASPKDQDVHFADFSVSILN
ncbi:polysaccharide lyase family 14 protein [Tulasnella calospora MUT 4182]|uniref:Polysaccharide lyase family 14 protein n=1 Tax=Tulasnella calospora MUT 4182 TaxID=1051891 RepID=A0A0C3LEX0_9AGAM|nr:polysaccharide lyase family 14 protein [Tulasnella calospora MUT 4182]